MVRAQDDASRVRHPGMTSEVGSFYDVLRAVNVVKLAMVSCKLSVIHLVVLVGRGTSHHYGILVIRVERKREGANGAALGGCEAYLCDCLNLALIPLPED